MDAFGWKRDNRAPFNILANAWAHQLHKLVHAGVITVEDAAVILEDSSVQAFEELSAFTGALTDRGTSTEAQAETEALISGEDPDDGPEAFSRPCFESLAVLMGMSVEDLQKLGGTSDEGEDPLGFTPTTDGVAGTEQSPVQPAAAPPTPPREDDKYSGA